jgi:hypothetical protein
MGIVINGTTVKKIIVKNSEGAVLCDDIKIVKVGGTEVFRKNTTVEIRYSFQWEKSQTSIECGTTYYHYYPSDPCIDVYINNQARPISSISFSGYIDLYEENHRLVNVKSGLKGSLSSTGTVTISGDRYWTTGSPDGEPTVRLVSTLTGTITFTDGSTYTFTIPNYGVFYAYQHPYIYIGSF